MNHELLGSQHFVKLIDHFERQIGWYSAQVGNFFRELLQVSLSEILKNFLPQFIAHGHQKDRRLAHSAQRVVSSSGV